MNETFVAAAWKPDTQKKGLGLVQSKEPCGESQYPFRSSLTVPSRSSARPATTNQPNKTMTALLKLIPLESIIAWLLRNLRGITREQWKFAIATVADMIDASMTGREKYDKAKRQLQTLGLSNESVNWLIETALSYLSKR